jgi:hypothetical protein
MKNQISACFVRATKTILLLILCNLSVFSQTKPKPKKRNLPVKVFKVIYLHNFEKYKEFANKCTSIQSPNPIISQISP